MRHFTFLFSTLSYYRLVKRSRALLGSNPARDNQTRAGKITRSLWPANRPGAFSFHPNVGFSLPCHAFKTHPSVAIDPATSIRSSPTDSSEISSIISITGLSIILLTLNGGIDRVLLAAEVEDVTEGLGVVQDAVGPAECLD